MTPPSSPRHAPLSRMARIVERHIRALLERHHQEERYAGWHRSRRLQCLGSVRIDTPPVLLREPRCTGLCRTMLQPNPQEDSGVPARPTVVIVGGGFGGLYAAKAFQGVPVDVTIIDKENYHLFMPLLYQVAMAGLSAGDIAAPLREIFRQHKNIRTLLGEVSAIDVEQRQVIYNGGILPYDAVIVATGSDYTYFGHDQWRPYA